MCHKLDVELYMNYPCSIYDSGLINGVGRFINGPDVPLLVFDVVPGTRYRLRLISNAPRAVFPFRIDQHNLTVIEADGFSVEPTEVESLELYRTCLHVSVPVLY